MDIKSVLAELSNASAIGNVNDAADLLEKYLNKYGILERSNGLTRCLTLSGKSDYTILLYNKLRGVQYGIEPDVHGWTKVVIE